jgi:hypothetical protein
VIEPGKKSEPLRICHHVAAHSIARRFLFFALKHVQHGLKQVALFQRFFPTPEKICPLLVG